MPTIPKNRAPERNRHERRFLARLVIADKKKNAIKRFRKAKHEQIQAERRAEDQDFDQ